MYTLVFIICIGTNCQAQPGPNDTFQTAEQCHRMAGYLLNQVEQQIQRGEIPDHTNDYRCVSWGAPA